MNGEREVSPNDSRLLVSVTSGFSDLAISARLEVIDCVDQCGYFYESAVARFGKEGGNSK